MKFPSVAAIGCIVVASVVSQALWRPTTSKPTPHGRAVHWDLTIPMKEYPFFQSRCVLIEGSGIDEPMEIAGQRCEPNPEDAEVEKLLKLSLVKTGKSAVLVQCRDKRDSRCRKAIMKYCIQKNLDLYEQPATGTPPGGVVIVDPTPDANRSGTMQNDDAYLLQVVASSPE